MRNAAQPFTKSKLSVITHLNGHITKTTLIFFAALFLFIGCRKSDRQILEPQKENKDYTELKKKFFNSSSADPEVQKVAADIKKQDSIFKFLPDFVKKNGIPKWEKTLYKVQGKNSGRQSGSNARLSTDSSEVSQGMFLIPLQSASSSEIKSYITAYKHNDSLYSYRLYNRDSLNTLQPDSNQTKTNLLNTQAVFGYFEKTINSKDSITVSGPENGSLKNVNISFAPNNQGGRNSISARQADITCTIAVSIAITYEWRDFTLGDGAWVAVSVTVTIDISCTGGGSDGTSGGFGDPNSIGNYWWQYGSGWPWNNNNYSGFYVDPNAPWYPWWTGGGYYGGSSGFSPTVDYLTTALELSWSQSLWLSQNPTLANQIYNYLITTTEPTASQIAFEHLNAMMTNATYLSFVENHALTGNANSVWWEDDAWLSDPSNINFDLDAINGLAYQPNPAEKALLKKYPVAGALIFSNKFVAENYTINYMGYNGLNDKSDAFRHCFYQTINTADVLIGPTITKLFSDAHETSTPPQLDLEKQMDLFNNSVGIAYGNTVGFFTSYSTIADEIKNNKIPNGELKYLKPLDANNNIIPGQTQLFFTNQ